MKRLQNIILVAMVMLGVVFVTSPFIQERGHALPAQAAQTTTPTLSAAFLYDDIGPVPIDEVTTPCGGGMELVRTFHVLDDFTVGSLTVGFNATHSYRGDIQVRLQSPAGTMVTIINRDSDYYNHYDISLSDSYINPIHSPISDNPSSPYYERKVQPSNPLSTFTGENSVGIWSLYICDYGYLTSGYPGIGFTYNRSQLQFEGLGLNGALSDALLTDNDADGDASPSDVIRYTATIFNPTGTGIENNVIFTVLPDSNSTLIAGSVIASTGIITSGNMTGDTLVAVDIGTMADGSSMTIQYDVMVNTPLPAGISSLTTRGLLNSNTVTNRGTIDPDELTGDTITPLVATTIGGRIWQDIDQDGIIDTDERGYDGVTVDVYFDADSSGSLTVGDSLLGTQLSTGGGFYTAGWANHLNFIIDITDVSHVLTDTILVSGTEPMSVTLAVGSTNDTIHFGYYDLTSITIVHTAMPANGVNFTYQGRSSELIYQLQWGNYGSGDDQFQYLQGIAIDNSGNVYVADYNNARIKKFDPDGTFLFSWRGPISRARDVAIDSVGNVYVVDSYQDRIHKFDSEGTLITQWGGYGGGNGQFRSAVGIAINSRDEVYVVDSNRNDIQVFDSNGIYLYQWGQYGIVNGRFTSPQGIAMDQNDHVYIADTFNHRIQKFDRLGVYLTQWGRNGTGNGEFDRPYDVTADYAGNVYVADYNNHRIQKFNSDGIYKNQWGGNGTGNGEFANPVGLATNPSGTIVYVADYNNHRIQKFIIPITDTFLLDNATIDDSDGIIDTITFSQIPSGTYHFTETLPIGWGLNHIHCLTNDTSDTPTTSSHGVSIDLDYGEEITCTFHNNISQITLNKEATLADGTDFTFHTTANYIHLGQWGQYGNGASEFNRPYGAAVDNAGNIYVTDMYNNRVQKFSYTGQFISQWGAVGNGNGQFNLPSGIAIDNAGNIYVADGGNHRIQKFDASGSYLTQWGTTGNGDGQFNFPYALTIDNAGYIYIADMFNHRIQKFDTSGTYLTQWGGYGSGNGQLNRPYGVATDNAGYIYVADTFNHRIQKFDTNGTYLTQWGSLGSGDGQFNRPYGINIDNNHGLVHVVDYQNHRLQTFAPDGTYYYQWGGYGTSAGQFQFPIGVALDESGLLIVTDGNNHRVQTYAPIIMPPQFMLDDATPDDGDGIDNTVTFAGMIATTYTFTEETLAGWSLNNISCTTTDTSEAPLWSGNDLTINIDAGEQVTCTFENGVNTPPLANNDLYTTTAPSLSISTVISGVLNNDSDLEGDTLSTILVQDTTTGTLTLNSDGTFDYIAPLNFMGTMTFTYQATDGINLSNIALVTIQITCPQNASFSVYVCIHQNGNNVNLYWPPHPDALGGYEAHRDTSPYFTPHAGTLLETLPADSNQYSDIGIIGTSSLNYYYYIVPLGCGSCTATSNHVAEFDFDIVSGSP